MPVSIAVNGMNQQGQEVARQRESDENYRLILENAREAIIIAQGLHLVMVNPAAERLTGFSAEHLMAGPFLDLIHPDDCELVIDRQQRRQRGEEVPVRYSFRVVCLDGSFKWVEQHSSRTSWNGQPATLAVLSDITERKRAAQQLRLQAMVLDQIQDLVTITDLEGDITYVNEATARAQQRSKKELIGTSGLTCGAGLDLDATRKEIVAQTLKQGYWRGEIVSYDHQGRPLVLDCRTTLIHDAEGQPVSICQIGVDITHRREAEEKVRQSETALKAILNASPETIFLMEVNGTILAANENLGKRVQTSLESLVGSNVYSYISPALAAARRQHIQQVMETRQPLCFRDQRNGLITEHYIYPVQGKGGDICQLAVFAMDITGRVQMEEALRQNQALLNATQRLSRVGGWEWDMRKQVMSWTDETYRIHGFGQGEAPLNSAELIRKSLGCYDAEDRPVLMESFSRCAEQGQPYDLQLPFTAADGRRLWVRTMAAPIREGERIVGVVGNIVDITERKQRENLLLARLRLSEAASALSQDALLQKVLNEAESLTGSCIGFFHFLEKDQQTLSLQAWSTSTLRSHCRAEGAGLHYNLDAAGVWVDCIRQRRTVIHNDYASLPHRKGLPAGHAQVIRELVVPIFRDGKIVAVFGVGNKACAYDPGDVELVTTLGDMAWDIVLRKRAEEAMAASEASLQEAHKIARIGRWELDLATRRLTWSDGIFTLLEIDRESFVPSYETFLEFVHPEDRTQVDQTYWKSVRNNTSYEFEHRLLMHDGRIKWVNEIGRTEYNDAGQPTRSIGTVQDITKRKQTEVALREREAQCSRIVDTAREGIWAMDKQRLTTFVNQHMAKMLGYAPEEMVGLPVEDFMFVEDLADHFQRMENRQRRTGGHYEHRFRRKDGRAIWTIVSATALLDDQGAFQGSFAMFTDITERRLMEARLNEQANFTRRILDSTDAHIAILDAQGIIVDVNTSWIRFAQENHRAGGDKLGPGVSYFCAWSADHGDVSGAAESFDGIRQVQCGERALFEIEYPCHSPTENRWFSLRAMPLQGNTGHVLISHTNITTLKCTEEHLSVALAEKEVLLREVHHRVKNNLAAIIGLMDMQRRIIDDPQGQNVLAELSARIRSMSLVHEKLYRSESLANIDFHEYIQALVSHLRTSFGAPQILCDVDAQGVEMPLDLAVPCGMIINELITNALKYAFPQRYPSPGNDSCRIQVNVGHDHGVYTLSVADNGVGLPPGFDWTKAKTLGLILVRMLGQHQLGGSYVQESLGGTRLSLTFTARKRKP